MSQCQCQCHCDCFCAHLEELPSVLTPICPFPLAMQNADNMLKDIIKVVDTSGDGKIQYEEFRVFVEAAERQLWMLFRSIDRDKDGRLDKNELRSAFKKAGLTVSNQRLSGFFNEVDMDHDGYITFDEWR